jgi:nitrite reductase/ring-hydroxylating ferredoxin subunit
VDARYFGAAVDERTLMAGDEAELDEIPMCTHRAGPLSEGAVDDTTVTCPLHGAQFNIWTGAVLRGPATEPLKTYRVVVEGDIGRVDVE